MSAEAATDDLVRRLRRATRRANDALNERDDLVRQLRAAGLSLREVGRAADLSHEAVAKIGRRGS